MVVRLEALSYEVTDVSAVATFWAGLLDRTIITEADGALLPGDPTQLGLRFVTSETVQIGRPRLHLHVTNDSAEEQRTSIDLALSLGGRHLDVGQAPDDHFVVLADPGGNELCVMDPDNQFLAGTGRLGEVTCSGSRAVGFFWRDVLGWPLVWDEGAQTAIQSPSGGTKISWDVWDGPAAEPDRQRFDLLVTADVSDEVDRLVSLGAERRAERTDGYDLIDPDGIVFRLRTG